SGYLRQSPFLCPKGSTSGARRAKRHGLESGDGLGSLVDWRRRQGQGMRYTQSRNESAEVLRMVIGRMGEHDAPFNPLAYAVWDEHCAWINPPISSALEARIAEGVSLDAMVVGGLYRSFVAE